MTKFTWNLSKDIEVNTACSSCGAEKNNVCRGKNGRAGHTHADRERAFAQQFPDYQKRLFAARMENLKKTLGVRR